MDEAGNGTKVERDKTDAERISSLEDRVQVLEDYIAETERKAKAMADKLPKPMRKMLGME